MSVSYNKHAVVAILVGLLGLTMTALGLYWIGIHPITSNTPLSVMYETTATALVVVSSLYSLHLGNKVNYENGRMHWSLFGMTGLIAMFGLMASIPNLIGTIADLLSVVFS